MVYTRDRLQYALHVFRDARQRENQGSPRFLLKEQRHLRREYSFRQLDISQQISHVSAWTDDNSSSDDGDEYTLDPTKKRRKFGKANTQSPPKRVKRTSSSKASQAPIAQPLTEDIAKHSKVSACFLTFSFAAQKNLFEKLVQQNTYAQKSSASLSGQIQAADNHSSGRLDNPVKQQFLQKLDKESAAVDNERGRRLRNNKLIPDQHIHGLSKKCFTCQKARTRCERSNLDSGKCKRCQKNGIKCFDEGKDEEEDEHAVEHTVTKQISIAVDEPTTIMARSVDKPTPSLTIRSHAASFGGLAPMPIIDPGSTRETAILLDSSPSPKLSPQRPPSGTLCTISTPWAHPIDFKHRPTDYKPCHFCADFRYGIYGYGELKEVEIIKFSDRAEYIEAGGGHRSCEREPTRMCTKCSLNRLHISRCRAHSLMPFGTPSKELQRKYWAEVLSLDWQPEYPSLKTGTLHTCSLCPQAALWQCRADMRFDKFGRLLSPLTGQRLGCGLILCNGCRLEIATDGILRRTSVELGGSADQRISRRADADFLFPGSLLHKAFK